MHRLAPALVALAVVTAACSDAATTTSPSQPPSTTATPTTVPPTTATTTTTTTTTAPEVFNGLVTGLAIAPCGGIGEPPAFGDWEVTFVRDGKLWAVGSRGGEARCLIDAADFPQAWGPAGDRLLTRGGAEFDAGAINIDGELPLAVPARFEGASWTRPTGTSVVGIDDDNRLIKHPIDGGEPVDLSFLARHDEVRYHPAGTHVLVVGESDGGEYGIWLATNVGTEPELLVNAESAIVSEPTVSHDGLFLYFVAAHDDVRHVHELALFEGAANEFDATIAFESTENLQHIVNSPWSAETVVAEGVCGGGMHTVVVWSEEVLLPEMESMPIGFLPDDDSLVLVAAWEDGCAADVAPDLYLVSTYGDAPPELVIEGVSQFALPGVRSPLPEPPPPPGEFDFDQFA